MLPAAVGGALTREVLPRDGPKLEVGGTLGIFVFWPGSLASGGTLSGGSLSNCIRFDLTGDFAGVVTVSAAAALLAITDNCWLALLGPGGSAGFGDAIRFGAGLAISPRCIKSVRTRILVGMGDCCCCRAASSSNTMTGGFGILSIVDPLGVSCLFSFSGGEGFALGGVASITRGEPPGT